MTKIKKITIANLMAIKQISADFNGCTAIIIGGNNKGKTTLCRALQNRLRGLKPDKIVNNIEKEGFAEMELTSGERFEWKFNLGTKKGESLTFFTKEDIKIGITRALSEKYFPPIFDIDEFLTDQPAQQVKKLQKLVGLDFADIEKRYNAVYDLRKNANYELNLIKNRKLQLPVVVEKNGNIKDLQDEKFKLQGVLKAEQDRINAVNDELRAAFDAKKEELRTEITKFNEKQNFKKIEFNHADEQLTYFVNLKRCFRDFVNIDKFKKYIDYLPKPEEKKEFEVEMKKLQEPEYLPTDIDFFKIDELDKKITIETQNKADYDSYIKELNVYTDWIKEGTKARKYTKECDEKLHVIKLERLELIQSANMPKEFSFDNNDILYNDLPMNKKQLSKSGIYIAALKLATMTIGEVRTLHFDASSLDNISLKEIEAWANENDLQLLIERPDFDGGEIKYELLEK